MRAWFEGKEADLAIFLILAMGKLERGYSIAFGLASFSVDGPELLLCKAIKRGPAWLSFVSNTVK